MRALRDVLGLSGEDSSQVCRIPSKEPRPPRKDQPLINVKTSNILERGVSRARQMHSCNKETEQITP